MARFLSLDWLAMLDRRATDTQAVDTSDLCVEHQVDDTVYHVRYSTAGTRFIPGPAQAATIRLRTDRATAAAIARGELSAQRAFMSGALRVEGDGGALATAHPALRALTDTFAPIRAATEW